MNKGKMIDSRPVEIIEPPDSEEERFQIGIVIMTWNRPQYVERCFNSLSLSKLEESIVAIVDDGSDDRATLDLVRNFEIPRVPVVRLMVGVHQHFLIHDNLRLGWDYLLNRWHCRFSDESRL